MEQRKQHIAVTSLEPFRPDRAESEAITAALEGLDSLGWDVFKLHSASNGHSLQVPQAPIHESLSRELLVIYIYIYIYIYVYIYVCVCIYIWWR